MDQDEDKLEDSVLIFQVCSRSEGGGPELIFQVCFERGWIMYQPGLFAEGGWHVMWRGAGFSEQQYSLLKQWQMVNHIPGADSICRKHHLARHLQRMRKIYGNIYNFSPQTYVLPADYLAALHDCSRQEKLCRNVMWICKPVAASQGRGITILQDLSVLKHDCTVVLQRYISNPLLICGYKFDLRLYVCVTSYQPLCVYAYDDGLTRFATEKYDVKNLSNRFSHLTNTSVNKYGPSYLCEKERIGTGCKWSVRQLRNYFEQCRIDDWLLWQRVCAIISLTVLSQQHQIPAVQQCFELYGFDVIIDQDLKPWLLEVNACPSLTADSTIDLSVKKSMLHDLFELVGLPRCRRDPLKEDVLANVVQRKPGDSHETRRNQERIETSPNRKKSYINSMNGSQLIRGAQSRSGKNMEGHYLLSKDVSPDIVVTEENSEDMYKQILDNDKNCSNADPRSSRINFSSLEIDSVFQSSSFDSSSTSGIDSTSDEETSLSEIPGDRSPCLAIETDLSDNLPQGDDKTNLLVEKNDEFDRKFIFPPSVTSKAGTSPKVSKAKTISRYSSIGDAKNENKLLSNRSNRVETIKRRGRKTKKFVPSKIKQFLPTIKCANDEHDQKNGRTTHSEGDLSPLLKNRFSSQSVTSAQHFFMNSNIPENSKSRRRLSANQPTRCFPRKQWGNPPESVGGWTLLFPVLTPTSREAARELRPGSRTSRTNTNSTIVRAAVTQIAHRLQTAKTISRRSCQDGMDSNIIQKSGNYFWEPSR